MNRANDVSLYEMQYIESYRSRYLLDNLYFIKIKTVLQYF